MKLKKYSMAALCLVAATTAASGAVSIAISIGGIRDAQGQEAALGSIGILVADIAGNGFLGDYTRSSFAQSSALLDGSSLSVGSLLGDDRVIASFTVNDDLGFSGFNDFLSSIDYGSGLVAGTPLALLWFPTLFEIDEVFNYGMTYGFYSNSLVSEASGATMGFTMPADGSTHMLALIDETIVGGSFPGVPTVAELTAQAVPEPSTYAIALGLVAGTVLLVRRRKRTK